jgi:hypothetical protein
MDYGSPLLVMLVNVIVRMDATNVGTFASHMVSEWYGCNYTKRMDVSIVDFMNILHFSFSV